MTTPDDTNHHPADKCCPCCGADPEEDRRKDERIDMLERGAIAEILTELRAIREVLKQIAAPAARPKSITDRELPDWNRYDVWHRYRENSPLGLGRLDPLPMPPPMTFGRRRKKEEG
jgi:hypothetical protein